MPSIHRGGVLFLRIISVVDMLIDALCPVAMLTQSCTGPKGSFHDKTTGDPIVNTTAFPSLAGMVAHATALGLSSGFYGDNCQCHAGERQVGVTHYAEDVALTLEASDQPIRDRTDLTTNLLWVFVSERHK